MIEFILGGALGSAGVAVIAIVGVRRQERKIRSLRRVWLAAANLSSELVCDPVKREVTWFYDGASALRKVQALHTALDDMRRHDAAVTARQAGEA